MKIAWLAAFGILFMAYPAMAEKRFYIVEYASRTHVYPNGKEVIRWTPNINENFRYSCSRRYPGPGGKLFALALISTSAAGHDVLVSSTAVSALPVYQKTEKLDKAGLEDSLKIDNALLMFDLDKGETIKNQTDYKDLLNAIGQKAGYAQFNVDGMDVHE